jgi:hypothetical protein
MGRGLGMGREERRGEERRGDERSLGASINAHLALEWVLTPTVEEERHVSVPAATQRERRAASERGATRSFVRPLCALRALIVGAAVSGPGVVPVNGRGVGCRM